MSRSADSHEEGGEADSGRGPHSDPGSVPRSRTGTDAADTLSEKTFPFEDTELAEGGKREVLDRVGTYVLKEEIGRGGQGRVYRALDPRLGRHVALKVLLQRFGPEAQEHLLRFRREAEAASRLDHPGICPVFEAGTADGTPYIAMRLVEGETLAAWISRARDHGGPKTQAESDPETRSETRTRVSTVNALEGSTSARDGIVRVLFLLERIALAVHAAHEAGILHRDIKPGNIMVAEDGQPVILDFGIARPLERDGATITRGVDRVGTPAYMSPEQLWGDPDHVDRRADVWALGVVLYEALTLSLPFEGPTREALLLAIQTEPLPDPKRRNPAIRRDLHLVLETCLDRDLGRRYQTALDLAEDLRRLRTHAPILARPVPRLIRFVRWGQRHPALATCLGAGLLFLTVGLVVSLVLLREAKDREATQARETAEKARLLDQVYRMSDVKELRDLVEDANERGWKPEPGSLPDLNRWLQRGRALEGRRGMHLDALLALGMADGPERVHAGAAWTFSPPFWWGTLPVPDPIAAAAPPMHPPLEPEQQARAWQRQVLRGLLRDLWAFRDTVARVEKLREFVLRVDELSLVAAADAWKETATTVARDPRYEGVSLKPQRGLIPLGKDLRSHLFEFAHVQSGEAPERDPSTGRLRVTEATGLVFVLIPPASFLMGAQSRDPGAPNYDRSARPMEGQPHRVLLDAFFLSKYEMTQGQWLRATGRNPSERGPGVPHKVNGVAETPDLTHPVENVSWDDAVRVLYGLGLELPTEARWECGARGGTSLAWWTGEDVASLAGCANVCDLSLLMNGGPPELKYERDLDDGAPVHAPVGRHGANGFGLHGVIGNVSEWCLDAALNYENHPHVDRATGRRRFETADPATQFRAVRGGNWRLPADAGRSAGRNYQVPGASGSGVGVRPARALE